MEADQFRAELEAHGLNQRDLSQRLGVDARTVNRWATGKIPVPQYVFAYFEALSGKAPKPIRLVKSGNAVPIVSSRRYRGEVYFYFEPPPDIADAFPHKATRRLFAQSYQEAEEVAREIIEVTRARKHSGRSLDYSADAIVVREGPRHRNHHSWGEQPPRWLTYAEVMQV